MCFILNPLYYSGVKMLKGVSFPIQNGKLFRTLKSVTKWRKAVFHSKSRLPEVTHFLADPDLPGDFPVALLGIKSLRVTEVWGKGYWILRVKDWNPFINVTISVSLPSGFLFKRVLPLILVGAGSNTYQNQWNCRLTEVFRSALI